MVKLRKCFGRWSCAVVLIMFVFLIVISLKPYLLQRNIDITPSEINVNEFFNPNATRFPTRSGDSQQRNRTFRIAWYHQNSEIADGISKYDPTKCDVSNCLLEHNTTLADIVVLRHSDLPFTPLIKKVKKQIWVLHTNESPHHSYRPPPDWARHIDLCASYMEFSDFFVPLYGRVEHRRKGSIRNFTGILKSKTKDAVWISSHCVTPAKREILVKELSQYLEVDMFGKCGTKKCGKQHDDIKQCESTFVDKYKFYLAFENSICDNYTTEKLYSLFRDRAAIIPVTNGPRDVSKYLPKGTYIDRFDFASSKKLAEELKRIGNNESEYIRFLQEKDKYIIPIGFQKEVVYKFQCDLCRFLQNIYTGKIKSITRRWQRVYNESLLCIQG